MGDLAQANEPISVENKREKRQNEQKIREDNNAPFFYSPLFLFKNTKNFSSTT